MPAPSLNELAFNELDPGAAAVIGPELLAREQILWCGRPHDTSALIRRAVAIVLVAIAALVLRSLPLDSSLAARADSNSILLAALVGFLIAEATVFHSFLVTTFYGVTNQRVIVVSGLRSRNLAGLLLDRLNTPQMKLRRHGNDLILRAPSVGSLLDLHFIPFANPSVPPEWAGQPEQYRLVGIQNAGRVYELIVEGARRLA